MRAKFTRLIVFFCGAVLCLMPMRGVAAVPDLLHIFSLTDTPGRLTADGQGNYYGVEPRGGDYGQGSIIRVAADGTIATLFSFDGSTDGSYPLPLTLGNDGNFYGFTAQGGTLYPTNFFVGYGTFFSITPAGVFTLLANFNQSTGVATPSVPPIQAADGSFYGVSDGLNNDQGGAIFHIVNGSTVSVLASYPLLNGETSNPNIPGTLLLNGNGTLYGTTYAGGANGFGNVFAFNAATSTTTSLFDFANDANGANPDSLVLGSDGALYGATSRAGANGAGTFFKLPAGGSLATLTSFAVTSSIVTAGGGSRHSPGSVTTTCLNGWSSRARSTSPFRLWVLAGSSRRT